MKVVKNYLGRVVGRESIMEEKRFKSRIWGCKFVSRASSCGLGNKEISWFLVSTSLDHVGGFYQVVVIWTS